MPGTVCKHFVRMNGLVSCKASLSRPAPILLVIYYGPLLTELPSFFGKELPTLLAICSFCFWMFRCICPSFLLTLRTSYGSDCISSWVHLFTLCFWLGSPWFNYWFSFTLAYSRISHEYSSLIIIVINLIFMFSLWRIDWVGSLYANRIFIYFCIKSSIGTQGEVG